MRLGTMIMNSDFDGQKEAAELDFNLYIPPFVSSPSGNTFSADVTAPAGAFFVNTSIVSSIIPDKVATSNILDITIREPNIYRVRTRVFKKDSTHYTLVSDVLAGGQQIQIPEMTFKAKVRLYVATQD